MRPLEHLWHATRELNAFETTRDLTGSIRQDFSVLQGHERGQVVTMSRQELPQVEQPVGALTQR